MSRRFAMWLTPKTNMSVTGGGGGKVIILWHRIWYVTWHMKITEIMSQRNIKIIIYYTSRKWIKWYNKYTRHQGQMIQHVNTCYYYHITGITVNISNYSRYICICICCHYHNLQTACTYYAAKYFKYSINIKHIIIEIEIYGNYVWIETYTHVYL